MKNDRVQRIVEILGDLVAIQSVNPRDGDTDGGESRVAQYVARWAADRGWECRLLEAAPGRANAHVVVPGETAGTILLQTHTDTVEVVGMTVPPFSLGHDIERDTVTGRGVCDAKGQLAIFMAAIEAVQASDLPHHTVLLAACVDEEHRYRGVSALCSVLPDCVGAVVGEPTSLRMVVAQKGVLRCGISVSGPGGHSSQPNLVSNPIARAAEIVTYLTEVVNARLGLKVDPLLGAGSLAVTGIAGGEAINIIPSSVVLQLDQRTLPCDDPLDVWCALKKDIETRWPDAVVEPPSLIDYGLAPAQDSAFHQAFQDALAANGRDITPLGVAFGSDASKIARCDVPVVVFGAGSIEQAHSKDEFVAVEQLAGGLDVIAALLRNGGHGAPRL